MSGYDDDDAKNHPASFDPRTWGRASAKADQPVSPASDHGGVPAPYPAISRRWLLAGAAGGGVVAVAGALLLLPRNKLPGQVAPALSPATKVSREEQRRLSLAPGETILAAITALGIREADLVEVRAVVRPPVVGPGRLDLVVQRRADGLLLRQLTFHAPDGSGVSLTRQTPSAPLVSDRFSAQRRMKPVVIHGEVDNTNFYSSAITSGMNDSIVPDFTRALAFDLDFAREVLPGDSFEAVYEEAVTEEGQTLGERRLLFAGLRHSARRTEAGSPPDKSKTVELYRFRTPDGKSEWFDGRGRGARRALMRTPLDGARVTSVFGPRKHPVLGYTRTHQGVDFGAAIGTPVFASGDGVVEFASVARGYGNYLKIRHNEHLVTAYAHLDRYSEGIAPGRTVRQGEAVALSGMTGIGTGPHLHYEIIIDGEHVDPLLSLEELGTAAVSSLVGPGLKAFLSERDRIDVLRTAGL